jgi:hypothetical protein
MTAPTASTVEEFILPVITHCQHDGRPVTDNHCCLTSLDQLKEPGRNLCLQFTMCETMLKQSLA